MMGENLWQEYCSFLDKDFSFQLKWNELSMREYIEKWKKTKMAKQLHLQSIKSIEDIPLTNYSDYPVMHELGREIEKLEKRLPRKKGENYCDYYDKLSSRCTHLLDGWLADKYSFCVKTSGTTGESKWIIHGETFRKNMVRSVMAAVVIGCSNKWGTTSFERGDFQLGIGAPAPYIGGYVSKLFDIEGVKMVPPTSMVDEEPDFMKKVGLALRYVKKAGSIGMIAGTGAMLKLISLYFTNRAVLYRNSCEITKPGMKKLILWLLWKYEHLFGKKLNKFKDMINPKGVLLGSFDTELYLDYVINQFEREPVNLYGSTETGFPLYGRPEKKSGLYPDLQTGYFEFLDRKNNIHKINELEKDGVYELVFTPFRSIVMRYKIGDLFRVVDFQKDRSPVFSFESRVVNLLDINNYFRLSMSIAFKAFKSAGFPPSANWAFTKELEPKERLILLMEKELDLTAKEVSLKLFRTLKAENESFYNYTEDFKINDPEDVIKVEYLRKGVFRRYAELKIKEGVPMGRIKPFRIILPGNKDIINFLRSA